MLDGFSHLASLTAPILSDSPLVCFGVAFNTMVVFALIFDICFLTD